MQHSGVVLTSACVRTFMLTWLSLIVGWVEVAWSNGTSNSYRMGADGKFDLRVVEPGPSSEAAGEPSSSSPAEQGASGEGSSTEEPEVVSPEKPQQENSSASQTVDESSEVLVEAVRVEEIPDEGIFTSDDIIDSSGNAVVVVSETAADSTEVVPSTDEPKETVGEIEEVTEDEGLPPARPPSLPPSRPNISSPNISVGETARR